MREIQILMNKTLWAPRAKLENTLRLPVNPQDEKYKNCRDKPFPQGNSAPEANRN